MTHAARPPGSRDEIAEALEATVWHNAELGAPKAWTRVADLVQTWIAYERDLTRYAIDSKLKAERERAIEEAAQCCRIVAEKPCSGSVFDALMLCHDAIRALKVIP